ncbi:MAG: hypothetical protein HY763_08670 [Planctomycetes bacterium]|nr:hypothetical protein [Planctomycetota bacterium]
MRGTGKQQTRRRASVYVLVLGCSLAAMTIAVGAVLAVRVDRRGALRTGDFLEARLYAQSAVEIGQWMVTDTTWRSTKPQGAWKLNQPLGRGLYSLYAVDPVDANFANNASDHVILTGIGTIGTTVYKLSVELEPFGPAGLNCLASAMHTNTAFDTTTTITISAPLSSNGTARVRATGVVNGNIEAVGTIQLDGGCTGTTTTGIAAKQVPTSSAFDYYIANAVEIPFASLPGGAIKNALLTPGANPYGPTTHPKGLYLIRCNNNTITVQDSRIRGSLILLDPGANSTLKGSVNIETDDPALPAIMVRGTMSFGWTGDLLESNGSNPNFNPVGSPYQGITDTDTADTYPGIIKGLVYVSGDLTLSATQTYNGAMVCGGTLNATGPVTVTHDNNLINAPPPGFEVSYRPMTPLAGSWTRVVN